MLDVPLLGKIGDGDDGEPRIHEVLLDRVDGTLPALMRLVQDAVSDRLDQADVTAAGEDIQDDEPTTRLEDPVHLAQECGIVGPVSEGFQGVGRVEEGVRKRGVVVRLLGEMGVAEVEALLEG